MRKKDNAIGLNRFNMSAMRLVLHPFRDGAKLSNLIILRSNMARLRVRFGSAVAMLAAVLVCAAAFSSVFVSPSAAAEEKVYLHQDWRLASSCDAKATGEQVSAVGFDVSKWHRTNLPNTAVGALVDDGTYKDPMMGTNLKSLPGMDYSTKHFFAIQDMPKDSPFICSWWWRTIRPRSCRSTLF